MLQKTQGVVLGHIKYKESSIIVRILTQELGVQSYVVNGVRSTRSKGKMAFFQPFTILDLVIYHKANRDLHRISEYKILVPFRTIPFDIRKTTITIFLCEALTKALKAHDYENGLYEFVHDSIVVFDDLKNDFENFHLRFLFQLTYYLGIQPYDIEELMKEAEGWNVAKLTALESNTLEQIVKSDYGFRIDSSGQSRKKFLEVLNHYFSYHIEGYGTLNSVKILNEIFH